MSGRRRSRSLELILKVHRLKRTGATLMDPNYLEIIKYQNQDRTMPINLRDNFSLYLYA